MDPSSSKILWKIFVLLAISLAGTNAYLWTEYIATEKENKRVRSRREHLFAQVEVHEQKRKDLDQLYAKQDLLLRDLTQLVFLAEKDGVAVPEDLIETDDRVFVLSSTIFDAYETSSKRIFLPPNIQATVFFREIYEIPQNGINGQIPSASVDPFKSTEIHTVLIKGAGWHSIDRRLEGKGESQRVVLKFDGKVERSFSVAQEKNGSSASAPTPKVLMINEIDPDSGKLNFPISDKWKLFFRIPEKGRVAYGFSIDQLVIEKEVDN